jgi:hypothetical protein
MRQFKLCLMLVETHGDLHDKRLNRDTRLVVFNDRIR